MQLRRRLAYRVTNGTISDLRERVYRLLKACQVEMIILDEAHRFRPKTFSEIRDVFDLLGIAVVLVGEDKVGQNWTAVQLKLLVGGEESKYTAVQFCLTLLQGYGSP